MCGWKFSSCAAWGSTVKFCDSTSEFGGISTDAGPVSPFHCLERREISPVFRLLAFRIEPDSQLDVIANRFADRVDMDVPRNLRAGQNQFAGVGTIEIVAFADGPFHQHGASAKFGVAARDDAFRVILRKVSDCVVGDPAARQRARTHLDRAHPSRLRQRDIRRRPPPDVLMMSGHRVGLGLDDEIGLTQFLRGFPFVFGGPLLRGGHVFGIAERRARHPPT